MLTGLLFGLAPAIFITCPQDNKRGGIYEYEPNRITICMNFEETGGYVAKHEFGHRLYFNKLSPYEKNKWTRIVAKDKTCVTPYACTSEQENFAENIRVVMMRTKTKNSVRISFIRGLLRKYEVVY